MNMQKKAEAKAAAKKFQLEQDPDF